MDVPDTLAQKIDLFRQTGRVFRRNEELFGENSWVQVMMGQGIVPERHHPLTAKLTDDELDRLLSTLRRQVNDTVATMPPHGDYVARYCPADRN
jgi:tryptophan halogenase